MKSFSQLAHEVFAVLQSLKDKKLQWQNDNQSALLQLKHKRKVAEHDLSAVLAKKNAELAHEIELMKTQQHAELTKLKSRYKHDILNYRQYLESLNQLKGIIQTTYQHLPEAISLTIHHHATALLNAMWEAEDLAEKIKLESQLIKFMTTVHEEACLHRDSISQDSLPNNTLRLIQQEPIEIQP